MTADTWCLQSVKGQWDPFVSHRVHHIYNVPSDSSSESTHRAAGNSVQPTTGRTLRSSCTPASVQHGSPPPQLRRYPRSLKASAYSWELSCRKPPNAGYYLLVKYLSLSKNLLKLQLERVSNRLVARCLRWVHLMGSLPVSMSSAAPCPLALPPQSSFRL